MLKRFTTFALIFFAGVATSVAVAWSLALALPLHTHELVGMGGATLPAFHHDLDSIRFDGWVLGFRSAPGSRMTAIVPEKASAPRNNAPEHALPPESAPAYHRLCAYTDRPVNMPPGTWSVLVDQSRGWPMLALCCQYEYNSGRPSRPSLIADGIPIAHSTTVPGDTHILPVHPLWPGFVIDALFYAFVLWFLIYLPRTLRNHFLRRRRLCPACRYPMGTSPICTECGTTLATRAGA